MTAFQNSSRDLSLSMSALREAIRKAIAEVPSRSPKDRWWNGLARAVYRAQYSRNRVFRRWQDFHGENPIRFLPILAFKESEVLLHRPSSSSPWFESSGTTQDGSAAVSRHHFRSLDLYRASVLAGWRWFLGRQPEETRSFSNGSHGPSKFVGVMPSFKENPRSSLSCMIAMLMEEFGDGDEFWCMKSGSWDWNGLADHLQKLQRERRPTVLFGTAFGWVHFLDWCARRGKAFRLHPERTLVFETGGYKGRSRELDRNDLYAELGRCLGVGSGRLRSEYSMCELSSQAYSFPVRDGKGGVRILFRFPPWCRHRVVRPGSSRPVGRGERGVLEIRDLANLDSCAFLRTEDMAIEWGEGFEWAGRLPRSGLKGCSLAFEARSET